MISKEDIKIRSEKTNEMLGTPPTFLVHSGITVITILLLILLSVSLLIKYPDTLQTPVIFTGGRPPVSVLANKSGEIQRLLVKDGQQVEENEVLAVLENPANYSDVLFLKNYLNCLGEQMFSQQLELKKERELNLGELNSFFVQWINANKDYRYYKVHNPGNRKIEQIQKEIEDYQILQVKQEKTIKSDTVDFPGLKIEMHIQGLKKELLAEQETMYKTSNDLITNIKQSYNKLAEELAKWENLNVLKSVIKGSASFYKLWSEKQFIKTGDEIMLIIPETTEIYAYSYVPVSYSGKLKPGQSVNIKLNAYPYQDYGMINGSVRSISRFSRDEQFIIKIDLPDDLVTSYKIKLNFIPEMKGEAQILTDDITLFERIFNKAKNGLR
jgi:multidrug resistance efflux pump